MKKIFINTDGGSRGNPGPAAIGIVFSDESGNILHKYNEFIGVATNNEAEYKALIRALELIAKSKWFGEQNGNGGEIICRLDSQLVVEQVRGNYKIKQDHLKELLLQIKSQANGFDLKISFVHIPRAENKLADKLVNEALDKKLKPIKDNHL